MASSGFKEAYTLLDAAPAPPALARPEPGRSFRDTLKQIERNFSADVTRWRTQLLSSRQGVRSSLEELIAASGSLSDPLRELQELIDFSDRMLDERAALRRSLAEAFSKEEALLAGISTEDARTFRRVTRRFLDLIADEYESRAAFYRFLKALHADFDPDAHGGPTFDNADDLIRYLHE